MLYKTKIWFIVLITAILVMVALSGCISSPQSRSEYKSTEPVKNATPEIIPSSAQEICTPITINQSDNTQVTIPCRPQRIVATSQHVVEMLIAIGAADTVVGTSTFCINDTTLRPYIPNAVDVGASASLDMERVITLQPDILILPERYSTSSIADKVQVANITLLYMDCYRLDSHAKDARLLGKLTGNERKAEAFARLVENTTELISKRFKLVSPEDYPSVYFESPTEYSTSGKGSSEDYIITLAGGKNIAGDLPLQSMTVNNEWILEQNPDYILKLVYEQYLPPNDIPGGYLSVIKTLKERNGWQSLRAVQNNRTYAVNSYMKTGPRAYIFAIYLAKVLHPDLFGDVNPRAMLEEYSEEYVGIPSQTIVIYPDPT